MILLPDTNILLHGVHLGHVPWSTVTQAGHIRIVICRTVQDEVDKKKHELKGRAQKRARDWASDIGGMAVEEQSRVLREAAPRVTVELAPFYEPEGWERPARLRLDWPDDMLTANALACAVHYGEPVGILTNDTGAYLTAVANGLKEYSVFPRGATGWLMEPEKDETQKELEKTRQALMELQNAAPRISFAIEVGGTPAHVVTVEAMRFRALTVEEVDSLVREVANAYPETVNFSQPDAVIQARELGAQHLRTGGPRSFNPAVLYGPSREAIKAYSDEYAQWVLKIRGFFNTLARRLEATSLSTPVKLQLNNIGSRPAEDVRVAFEATGGLLLQTPRGADKPDPTQMPAPPEPPQWRSAMSYGPMGRMAGMEDMSPMFRPPEALDPHSFYWRNRPVRPVSKWEFTCSSFQHGGGGEEFGAFLMVQKEGIEKSATVGVEVYAKNLAQRFTKSFPVRVSWREGDTMAEARRLSPPMVRFRKVPGSTSTPTNGR
ncbi:PIN domain-containing protein [Roseomonas gilardii]|uniref:PIN domain-containing protein n=1 Tax=Roseomonas gilardii TaxID=257708 RepID=UPI00048550E6|nr:PIN domain-containing protein [Roseomonas gilardii]SUE63177.1 Uncharacterised protein [Roseomonas gilardii subsp. rosea]